MVRVVDSVVDGMDRSRLDGLYAGGGAPAYDPVMMLKVVLFAYASGMYSSRKIEVATRENIHFMWLTGLEVIDHNTINRFRTQRIAPVFADIFTEVVLVLAEGGYITLDTYFLDGTKIEANANKYTHVWKKNTDRYQQGLQEKVYGHLSMIDQLNDEEEALAPPEPCGVDSQSIKEAARKIDERLAEKEEVSGKEKGGGKMVKDIEERQRRELVKARRFIDRDYLPRMENYEAQQEIFNGRNSYSRTDTDRYVYADER